MVAWHDLPWKQGERQVFRLPKRLDQATQQGEGSTVPQLPNLWSKSW
jgi:hypothetical protein